MLRTPNRWKVWNPLLLAVLGLVVVAARSACATDVQIPPAPADASEKRLVDLARDNWHLDSVDELDEWSTWEDMDSGRAWPVTALLDSIEDNACFESQSAIKTAIPGKLITWLLADPQAGGRLPPSGFRVCNVTIDGDLEQPVPRTILPLYLVNCVFPDRVVIAGHFSELSLAGSLFPRGLEIRESVIQGRLDLREIGCKPDRSYSSVDPNREIRIVSTTVAGDLLLACSHDPGTISDRYTGRMVLESLTVSGDLDLSRCALDAPPSAPRGPSAALVYLRNVSIDKDLTAHSCRLRNPGGYALWAEHVHIGRNVYLDASPSPSTPGTLEPPAGEVSPNAFTAEGSMIFTESVIHGMLVLRDALLEKPNPDGDFSFRLRGTPIGRSLTIEDLETHGDLDLNRAIIADSLHVEDSRFLRASLLLTQARITGSAVLGPELKVLLGEVLLDQATIGGNLECRESSLVGGGSGFALSVQNARISGDVVLGTPAGKLVSATLYSGDVSLDGAEIGGILSLRMIDWDEGSRLILCNASAGCLAGMPTSPRPEVLTRSRRRRGVPYQPDNPWLNWPDAGHLDLRAFIYHSISPAERVSKSAVVDWLHLQLRLPAKKEEPGKSKETQPAQATSPGSTLEEPRNIICFPLPCPQSGSEVAGGGGAVDFDEGTTATSGKPEKPPKSVDKKDETDHDEVAEEPATSREVDSAATSTSVEQVPRQSYRQLARVLEEIGRPQIAREIRIQLHEDIAEYADLAWWQAAGNWLFGALSGYGYKPLSVIPWILGMVGVAVVLFEFGYRRELVLPAKGASPPATRRRFNPFIFALDVFLPIIRFGQAEQWRLNTDDTRRLTIKLHVPGWRSSQPVTIRGPRWVGLLRLWLWLSIALGWMLTTFLVAGLTGLLKT